jgi:hypothetical protein
MKGTKGYKEQRSGGHPGGDLSKLSVYAHRCLSKVKMAEEISPHLRRTWPGVMQLLNGGIGFSGHA